MSTTLTLYPSTVSIDDWTDSENAYTEGGALAKATPPRNGTKKVRYGNFGFFAPTTAVISSCTVTVKYRVTSEISKPILHVDAIQSGTPLGVEAVATESPLVMTEKTMSAAVSSSTQMSDGVFEVEVVAERGDSTNPVTFEVAHVKLEVIYTPDAGGAHSTGGVGILAISNNGGDTGAGPAATGGAGTLAISGGAVWNDGATQATGGVGAITASWNGSCAVVIAGTANA